MQTVVALDLKEVEARLQQLGLSVEELHAAVMAGLAERNTCTANDPPGVAGILMWARAVRMLREIKIPLGWRRSNRRGLATVVAPDGNFAVGVSSGDERTGLAGAAPRTKYGKGAAWIAAVEENRQLGFFSDAVTDVSETVEEGADAERVTWLLLFHLAVREVRCELALPAAFGAEGKVEHWQERILLPAVPLEPEPKVDATESAPPIDVPVVRRAE